MLSLIGRVIVIVIIMNFFCTKSFHVLVLLCLIVVNIMTISKRQLAIYNHTVDGVMTTLWCCVTILHKKCLCMTITHTSRSRLDRQQKQQRRKAPTHNAPHIEQSGQISSFLGIQVS